ncbi:MAG: hypothetical protein GXY56_05485, partial [Clostridiales bacterium]|nr:hypothetical protein [Clostridiales bacterium]
MFKRKMIAIVMVMAMVFGGIPGVFAQDAETDVQAMFEDMPEANYWSYASLSAAVENGLLNG